MRIQTWVDRYQQALDIDPNFTHALSGMGEALYKLGNSEDAQAFLNRALEINPYTLEALVYKGDILKETGHPKEATDIYKQALEINPSLNSVLKSLAECLTATGNIQEAKEITDKLKGTERRAERLPEIRAHTIDTKKLIADVKAEMATTPATAPSIPTTVAPVPVIPVVAPSLKEKVPKTIKKVERGFNYLFYEERSKKVFQMVGELLLEGVKVFCITPTFPQKLRKEYGLQNAEIMWISESGEKEAINPRRLEFEIARAIGNFIRGNVDSVLVIDGFELLMLQNGYENVMKFVKRTNDLASVNGATIIVPLNPSAMKKEDLPLLAKEFDKVQDLMDIDDDIE
jgi:hypothetical protein